MAKLLAVIVFSLFYDVQLTVFPKERSHHETVQDVQKPVPPVVHERRELDPQEKPVELEPDARWHPPLNALL